MTSPTPIPSTASRPAGAVPAEGAVKPAMSTEGPERMRELDFLVGTITCEFDNGTTMTAQVRPILGGGFLQMDLRSWDAEGETIVDQGYWTIGWSEPDRQYLSYYFDNTGMQGHSSSPGWENGVISFTGDHVIIGGKVRTGTRDEFQPVDDDHFVLNSYYQDENGEWQFYDRQDCRRER